jgi:hypothetical protein
MNGNTSAGSAGKGIPLVGTRRRVIGGSSRGEPVLILDCQGPQLGHLDGVDQLREGLPQALQGAERCGASGFRGSAQQGPSEVSGVVNGSMVSGKGCVIHGESSRLDAPSSPTAPVVVNNRYYCCTYRNMLRFQQHNPEVES